MAAQAALGKKALDASDYDEAIEQYTLALKQSPTSPDYFIHRSTAYTRSKKNDEALYDAEKAVVYAHKRAKKELITEAQFRRGVCMFNLQRYGDAEFVFGIVKRMKSDHKMAPTWIFKTEKAIKELADDNEKRKCTVKEIPEIDASGASSAAETASQSQASTTNAGSATNGTATIPPVAPPQQTSADKIRYDWYQNNNTVYFTLMVKGAPQDKTTVDITERSLNISFPLISGSSYDLTLDPLFASVVPEKCITKVLSTKIEIQLAKIEPGVKWKALESSDPTPSTKPAADGSADTNDSDAIKHAVLTSQPGPAYPTSSKSGPKDWDKITRELRTADNSTSTTGQNPSSSRAGEDDDDDDDVGGDATNHFFKKLFKHASPETQRAMMKSYTESNGTALSTNWEEVSKGKVETTPPDGMEAKKW